MKNLLVITQNVCDGKNTNTNNPNDPIREFCSTNINSDALLDLVVRFSDYDRKTSNSEAACLYYGLTSRKLKLQNDNGVALGTIFFIHLIFEFYHIRLVMERTSLQ